MKIVCNIVEYVMVLKCLVLTTAQNVVVVFAKWIIIAVSFVVLEEIQEFGDKIALKKECFAFRNWKIF